MGLQMTKQTIEIEVPSGFRVVGYRIPQPHELFISAYSGKVLRANGTPSHETRMVVKKIEYRVPTIEDHGKSVEVRDFDQQLWAPTILYGVRPDGVCYQFVGISCGWNFARIEV